MRETAVEAARFLAAHASERVMLADVADHVGYSPFHLARSFEKQLGVPPGQFLAAHRFQRAKELLLTSDDRVLDICFEVGFASAGTFTRRFGAAVGTSPQEFRRLPHVLADAPARPVDLPGGDPGGGVVRGSAQLSPAACAALGETPAVYVGLFRKRAARGLPIAGTLLAEPGPFVLTGIPPGTYWLLSSAVAAHADALDQLIPPRGVTGAFPSPVTVTACRPIWRALRLDVGQDWSAPVLVALPALASPGAQDRRGTS